MRAGAAVKSEAESRDRILWDFANHLKEALNPSLINISSTAPAPEEPDVMLEYMSPGPFKLHNYGATACKIQVATSLGSDSRLPEPSGWYEIRFPLVTDLHREPISIVPDVTPTDWGNLLSTDDQAVINILRVLARMRANDIQEEQHPGRSNSLETDKIIATMEPLRYPVTVTYTDRNDQHSWRRDEAIVYEPAKKRAWIEHGERKQIR
jgi:hypothetical protein